MPEGPLERLDSALDRELKAIGYTLEPQEMLVRSLAVEALLRSRNEALRGFELAYVASGYGAYDRDDRDRDRA